MEDQFFDSVPDHDETSEDVSESQSSRQVKRSLSDTEFICSCCFELMIQPTSLTCGHSFCRHCLALWFLTSKKCECPSCRQHWQGKPQVNISLRNLIEKYFREELKEREEILKDADIKFKLSEFERRLNSSPLDQQKTQTNKIFFSGVFVSLGVVLAIYLAWLWRHSDKDMLIRKPLSKWTQADVIKWIEDLGSWTEDFINATEHTHIDGKILMAMDEDDISLFFNTTQSIYLNAIKKAVIQLKSNGVKFPTNLWEYKIVYPGSSILLLYGLKDFPRTTMLYMYMYEYQDQFLPFIHQTCPAHSSDHLSFSVPSLPSPTTYQWIEFVSKGIVLPYWLIAQFIIDFLSIHYWTSRFCLVDCLLLTILEASIFLWLCKCGARSIVWFLGKQLKILLTYCVMAVIWPIVPNFICDIFFYLALYLIPLRNLEKARKALLGQVFLQF